MNYFQLSSQLLISYVGFSKVKKKVNLFSNLIETFREFLIVFSIFEYNLLIQLILTTKRIGLRIICTSIQFLSVFQFLEEPLEEIAC